MKGEGGALEFWPYPRPRTGEGSYDVESKIYFRLFQIKFKKET